MRNIKNIIKTSVLILAGSFTLWNCESETDNLGSQFFEGDMAEGTVKNYPVIAYNVSNDDKVESDASKLTQATLGAFNESQFGLQKSSYVTQVRLQSYAPDFGTNAVVDSVVLVMKPLYASDSITTTTKDDYVYPVGDVPAKKVVNTYPITKYGKAKKELTINIHEVDDYLGVSTDTIYSNKTVNYGTLIGTKTFDGKINSVKVTKKDDNTELLSRDASLRIPLFKEFFQNKIIAKNKSSELSDASNFIRYFKGMRISVAEDDGYIFKFNPNELEMVMYYKRDVTTNGTTAPAQTSISFNLGSGNVHFNQIAYNRENAAVKSAGYNAQTGDKQLFPQGMGGPGFGIKIPDATVDAIKQLYKTQNIGILSAKIRLYSDVSAWNNTYAKPPYFTIEQKGSDTFLSELTAFSSNGVFNLVKAFDITQNPAYYEFTITQTFKDIVEKEAQNKDFIINVGNYETNATTGQIVSPAYNSRAYTPNRVVLVGTDAANPKAAQLSIIYTKK